MRNFEYKLPKEILPEDLSGSTILKEGIQLGVIAQELQQVLPECVTEREGHAMSVNTDHLIWLLINSVKELTARITVLENK